MLRTSRFEGMRDSTTGEARAGGIYLAKFKENQKKSMGRLY